MAAGEDDDSVVGREAGNEAPADEDEHGDVDARGNRPGDGVLHELGDWAGVVAQEAGDLFHGGGGLGDDEEGLALGDGCAVRDEEAGDAAAARRGDGVEELQRLDGADRLARLAERAEPDGRQRRVPQPRHLPRVLLRLRAGALLSTVKVL